MKTKEILQRIEEGIANIGFKLLHIRNSEDHPVYSYTVGLAREGLPDLFLSGIPNLNLNAHLIFRTVNAFREQQLAGPVVEAGKLNIDSDSPFQLLLIDGSELFQERVLLAKHFYKKPATFVQIIWPDLAGHLPFSPHYDKLHFPQELFCVKTLH